MSSHILQNTGLSKEGLSDEQDYAWELEKLLSDEDKEALNRSSVKIGKTVDNLAASFSHLPLLERVIMDQDDLKAQLQHHRKFLVNAAKGQQKKVESKLDGLIAEQDKESTLVQAQLASAEQRADGDFPGAPEELNTAAPDEHALQSVIEGGAKATVEATVQALRAAESDGTHMLTASLDGQADDQRQAADAVREGGEQALAQSEAARKKAEDRMRAARGAGASGASIYLTLDNEAQGLDERLAQLKSMVDDLAPAGIQQDYQYTKAVAALARLEEAMHTMPKAKGSLVESRPSLGTLLEASGRVDVAHDARLAAHAETLRQLRKQLHIGGGLAAERQQVSVQ